MLSHPSPAIILLFIFLAKFSLSPSTLPNRASISILRTLPSPSYPHHRIRAVRLRIEPASRFCGSSYPLPIPVIESGSSDLAYRQHEKQYFSTTAMARGDSQSQAASAGEAATRQGSIGVSSARGSAAAAGLRRRRLGRNAGGFRGNGNNMLRFYTDEAPGLKITPNIVLFMSLCFIGLVTILHVVGKLYNHNSV